MQIGFAHAYQIVVKMQLLELQKTNVKSQLKPQVRPLKLKVRNG